MGEEPQIYPDKNIKNADWLKGIEIRPFEDKDAEDCFRIRTESFIKLFYDKIGLGGVVAAVNDYLPSHYIEMAEDNPCFVATRADTPVAFVMSKLKENEIEIIFFYVKLDYCRQGVGKELFNYFEEYIKEKRPKVEEINVRTAFPEHNQGFYQKMGFIEAGESSCKYSGLEIDALKMVKKIK